jgi:hypothetical protein
MKKELIGLDNLDSFLCKTENRIFIDNSAVVLTPGARDELTKRHVEIAYGFCPDATSCGLHAAPAASGKCETDVALQALIYGIAASLKHEHGITDPIQLCDMTRQALERLKSSL